MRDGAAFRADALNGTFPGEAETARIEARELEQFLERLDARAAG